MFQRYENVYFCSSSIVITAFQCVPGPSLQRRNLRRADAWTAAAEAEAEQETPIEAEKVIEVTEGINTNTFY